MGHSCNKFGLTEILSSSARHISVSDYGTALKPHNLNLITTTYGTPAFANPLALAKKRQGMPLAPPILHDTLEMEKWRSARDMFTQYDVSRPSGWLSDVGDLSLSGDGNASPRRYCRYCHICSTPTWAPTYCSTCGHHFCQRCVCEASGRTPQDHTDILHSPSLTVTRDVSHQISSSRSKLGSAQQFHRDAEITRSTANSRHHDRIDRQQYRSPSYKDDTSWLNRNHEHTAAPIAHRENTMSTMRYDRHTNQEHYKYAVNQSKQRVRENPFLVSDRKSQEHETEETSCIRAVTRAACDDPMCRATHAGHHPFRHSVSCSKHQSQEKSPALEPKSSQDRLPTAETFEKLDSDKSLPQGQAHTVHHHHTASFHSPHHIAEHLSTAVGHNAYDLLKHRNEKEIQRTPSPMKTNIKPLSYLEPLTPAKSVTELDSFQWAPDSISPGYHRDSIDGRQQSTTARKVVSSGSDHRQPVLKDKKTTHELKDDMPGEAATHGTPREIRNNSNLSLGDHNHPKVLLASTPLWLRNPTKEVADATASLHHINTKSHRTHEHEHGYLSSVNVDG